MLKALRRFTLSPRAVSVMLQGYITIWVVGQFMVMMILFFVAALHNRCGHYIFVLWFLLSSFVLLFSSPILSGRRLDVYHP